MGMIRPFTVKPSDHSTPYNGYIMVVEKTKSGARFYVLGRNLQLLYTKRCKSAPEAHYQAQEYVVNRIVQKYHHTAGERFS